MKTVGLIVEYNPFHYGHAYHLQHSKKITGAEAVVAVMSGNFLQRGEPALVNKWARAKMALLAGVDLVFELPSFYASQPAEWFAFGAVSVLESSGIVDSICFGTEDHSLEQLLQLADLLYRESEPFKQHLREQLKKGVNYPAAYSQAITLLTKHQTENQLDLSKPNNILGLHYLIALKRLHSSIKPFTIKRTKAGYHQQDITDHRIASATAIRNQIMLTNDIRAVADYVPASTLHILEEEMEAGRAPVNWELFIQQLYHQLLIQSKEELGQILGMNEGLENRLKQSVFRHAGDPLSFEQLLDLLKTKRYTAAKLQRTLLNVLLNFKKDEHGRNRMQQGTPYLRVLGFSPKGRELLKTMKKTARVPIITNVNRSNADLLEADIKAASVYALAYKDVAQHDVYQEFCQAPLTPPNL